MRDYGIEPQVWGGAEDFCEHQWGDQVRAFNANAVQGPGDMGGKNVNYRCTTKEAGKFCQRCGAWCGSLGLEPTPELFVAHMVEVFEEVRRVLRSDGTLWLNLGDSYASATQKGNSGDGTSTLTGGGAYQDEAPRPRGRPPAGATSMAGEGKRRANRDGTHAGKHTAMASIGPMFQPNRMPLPGLKPKDLVGIPWMVAFALRAAGWYLRQDIIWQKPNPMPESVTDRCTKAHEYIFLLSKSGSYYYDQESVLEPISDNTHLRVSQATLEQQLGSDRAHAGGKSNGRMKAVVRGDRKLGLREDGVKNNQDFAESCSVLPGRIRKSGNVERKPRPDAPEGNGKNQAGSVPWEGFVRNKRSVWTVTTQPFSEAHFATFPPALIEPCIKAGCPEGGTVLDPFGGAGTTGLVADRLKRNAILLELNPSYADIAERRIIGDAGMFAEVAAE